MTLLTGVFLGLATHATFHFHEPKRPLVPVAGTLFGLPLCGIVYEADFSTKAVLTAYAEYVFALCVSIILYRLSPFHPLAPYPGPLLFKITKLAGVWASYSGRHHLILKALHDKHGPVVRIGPNDISMVDADAVPAVLGVGGLPKGRYYDGRRDPSAPMNLVSMEPGEMHTRRRRLWSRGLSSESLKEYEDIIAERARELVDGLERHSDGAVNIVQWINFFTFDFMGDMAFGQGYGMLHAGADHSSYWPVIENFALSAAMDLLKMRKFGVDSATARMQRGSKSKDLYYHLADEAGYEAEKPNIRDVVADGALAIIAGADTTSSAMSSLLYLLMSNPSCMRRLQKELDHVYSDVDNVLDSSKHGELKYLNACIHEALRLHPPVPTSGPREIRKGTGDRIIAGYRVPEQTQIYIPSYVLHRDARYYPDAPDSFKPERWLDGRETQNSTAFIPFSFGPANCIGRHLARREMLMVMSLLLRKFEPRFAEGFEADAWPATLHDYFVSARGPLLVRLQIR